MKNAKKELIEIVNDKNLEILEIDCSYNNEKKETIESLDFEYDDDFGSQELFGMVYCINKDTREIVWLTRGEYDGSEWWDVNRVPEFYGEVRFQV